MSSALLLKKLRFEDREFVTAPEMKAYCKSMKVDYDAAIRYFTKKGYIVRIFTGIFYLRSLEELKLGRSRYNHLELVARGMELKKVEKWYFGLHTALKMNDMTHEYFTVDDVISESVFRAKPIKIADHEFKFYKLSKSLFDFGITGDKTHPHSDPEKTILDFIYVWRYNSVPEARIVADVSEWSEGLSKQKIRRYASMYPTTVSNIAMKVI